MITARAPGVGPKLADRDLLTELKDKVGRYRARFDHPARRAAVRRARSTRVPIATVLDDAVSALVNLGYRRGDAFGPRSTGAMGDAMGQRRCRRVEELIRAGLKELSAQ